MTSPFNQFDFDLDGALGDLEIQIDRSQLRPIGDRLSPVPAVTDSCNKCTNNCTGSCTCKGCLEGLDFGVDLEGLNPDIFGQLGR